MRDSDQVESDTLITRIEPMNAYAIYAFGTKGFWEYVTEVDSAADAMFCVATLRHRGFTVSVSKVAL